jgi:hypothetical protein
MKNLKRRIAFIIALTSLLAPVFAAAGATPQPAVESIFKKLMTATIANDYDAFAALCDDPMKAAITKQNLEGVSKQIEPRSKRGYESEYLGELKQRGYQVHLWRLRFKDAGDDVLATLSLKDEKVGGFFLK